MMYTVLAEIVSKGEMIGARIYDRGEVKDIDRTSYITGGSNVISTYVNESNHTENKIDLCGNLISGPGYTYIPEVGYVWYDGRDVQPDSSEIVSYHLSKYGYHIQELADVNVSGLLIAVRGVPGSDANTDTSNFRVVKVCRDRNVINRSNDWGDKRETEYRELSRKGRLKMVTRIGRDVDRITQSTPARINRNCERYSGKGLSIDRCDTEGSVSEPVEVMAVKSIGTQLLTETDTMFILDTILGERIYLAKEYVLGNELSKELARSSISYTQLQQNCGGLEVVKGAVIGVREGRCRVPSRISVPMCVEKIECELRADLVLIEGEPKIVLDNISDKDSEVIFARPGAYTKFISSNNDSSAISMNVVGVNRDTIKAHIDYIVRCYTNSLMTKIKQARHRKSSKTEWDIADKFTEQYTGIQRGLNILVPSNQWTNEKDEEANKLIKEVINDNEKLGDIVEYLAQFDIKFMHRHKIKNRLVEYCTASINVKQSDEIYL